MILNLKNLNLIIRGLWPLITVMLQGLRPCNYRDLLLYHWGFAPVILLKHKARRALISVII